MKTRLLRLLQWSAVSLDMVSLNLVFVLLQQQLQHINFDTAQYYYLWIWLNLGWIGVSYGAYLYHEKYLGGFEAFCRRTMQVYVLWLLLTILFLYFSQQFLLSRFFILSVLSCFGIILIVNRFIYLGVRSYYRQTSFISRKVAIIGFNETAKKLANYLEEGGQYTEIIGFCEEEENVLEWSNYPIISSIKDSLAVSKQFGVQEVYSTIAPETNAAIYRLIEEADQACVRFKIIPDLTAVINRTCQVSFIKDLPVLSLRNAQVDDPGNIIRKRIFDLVVSGLVIVFLLSWLVPLIGLMIKLESNGPVFFRQQRTGKNNMSFWCLKFRSMRVNGEANNRQATRNDHRLTRIGRFLRKSSLDELPQFLNVFKGEMSVVGPRPHMLKHTLDYSKLINDYMVRQFLKPGVTGWAQVNGFRGETRTLEKMQGRVECDLWYLENWSLWLDVRVMFMTIFTLLKEDKNAF